MKCFYPDRIFGHDRELGRKLPCFVVSFHLRTPATNALLDEHYEIEPARFAEVAEVANQFGDAVTDVVGRIHVVLLCNDKQLVIQTRTVAICVFAIDLVTGN
jgi:hypothetical protein